MTLKTHLDPADVTAIIDQAENLRDKLILSFLADTGCRVSELLAIKVSDVDLKARTVLIPHLKRTIKKQCPKCSRSAGHSTKYCSRCGHDLSRIRASEIEVPRKFRIVNVGKQTLELLLSYCKGMQPSEKIIQLTRQGVYHIVRDTAAKAGFDGKVMLNPDTGKYHFIHPHDFRSALAVSWLEVAGADGNKQKALQDHLGHQNFNTTMRYNKLAPGQVSDVADEVRRSRFGEKDE